MGQTSDSSKEEQLPAGVVPPAARARSNAAASRPKPRVATHVGAPAPKRTGGQKAPEDPDKRQAAKGARFIGLVFLGYVAFLFFSGQIDSFVAAFQNLRMEWLVGALVCMCLYFVFGVGAYVVAVYLDHDSPVGVRDLMGVEAAGNFFGNLTPMMVGALPAQIYHLTKSGLEIGSATATQFTRFIMFQLGVVAFAAAMLLAKFGFFLENYGDIVFLNVLVFAGHFLELLFLFVVCLCPNFVRRIGNRLLVWASRRGWVKDYDKWYDMINNQVSEFARAFKRSATHIPDMVLTLVVTIAQLACLYVVPWFVLRAFGIEADPLTCIAAGSMVQLVSSAVPLPGGTGGAEGGFALFFGSMFGSSATAGFLVWRAVTFFFPTFTAVPLLGLRSSHKRSIYQRVRRISGEARPMTSTFGAAAPSKKHGAGARKVRGGIAYVPKPKKKDSGSES